MPTKLTKPVTRETLKTANGRNILLTIAPAGSQSEALIGMRLKGTRAQIVVALSDVYRMGCLWYGQKIHKAKREAKAQGVPWRTAKKAFEKANRID